MSSNQLNGQHRMMAKLCCCTGSDYCNSVNIEPDTPAVSMGFGTETNGVALLIGDICFALSLVVGVYMLEH